MTVVTDNDCYGIRCSIWHVLQLPSYVGILETAVLYTVSWKLWSFIDDLADTRLADDVCGASRCVSVWKVVLDETTKINFRLRLMFAEKEQQILPHDVSATSINQQFNQLHHIIAGGQLISRQSKSTSLTDPA